MSEESYSFRPDNDAPAKQHLIDAALDDLKQYGTTNADEFLEKVNDQLNDIDQQQETIVSISDQKNRRKPRLLTGIGIAAALAATLFAAQFYFANQTQNKDISAVGEIKKAPAEAPSFTSPIESEKMVKQVSNKPLVVAAKEDQKGLEMLAETDSSKLKAVEIEATKGGFLTDSVSDQIETLDSNSSTFRSLPSPKPSPMPTSRSVVREVPPAPALSAAPFPASESEINSRPEIVAPQSQADSFATKNHSAPRESRFQAYGDIEESSSSDGVFGTTASPVRNSARQKELLSKLKGNQEPSGGRTSIEVPIVGRASSERYSSLVDNAFLSPLKQPLSTFSVDVDTASYSNIRRMINSGQKPPADAVRIEEMINYFSYDYPQPEGDHPFSFAIETANSPWNTNHQLLRVGIQGKDIQRNKRPAANLVFLLDVSGSMNNQNKLPLVKKSMELLVEELNENDTLSIVVYAGAEGLRLPPTKGDQNSTILKSLENLQAGGSTNGGAGIKLAYKVARENFKKDGINRVILCTDGDFNVGRTDQGDLVSMVENKAKNGTYLTVLGFGSGNINDSMLEAITNKGNGNYFYIDSIKEGRKVLLQDLMSTLMTIAKDVKIQIEFNPKHVQNYRLIGYANRQLEAKDFIDDKIDAGEVGAGHSVTALYEIVPAGAPPIEFDITQNLKYQKPKNLAKKSKIQIVDSDELCTVKLRYKKPDSNTSQPIEQAVTYKSKDWQNASNDYQFAAAVALWGMLLRDSDHVDTNLNELIFSLASEGKGSDPFGRRTEFIQLVEKWQKQ